MKAAAELESIADVPRASVLLHPLRLKVLDRAREPRSASQIASELGLPRQRVNYHVRELARVGFLRRAGRRRRRNLYEQRYVATARAYQLSPELLGPLGADAGRIEDRASAAYLLAVGERLLRELGRASREAIEQRKRLATLTLDAELRFESAGQREAFASALRDAVLAVVAEHASPARLEDGRAGPGRPYRLVLGCHPLPPRASEIETPEPHPAPKEELHE